MKKIILFTALVFIFVACKKNGNNSLPVNTIEVNINGTDYTFNKNTFDTVIISPAEADIPLYEFRASLDTGINSKTFAITLVSDNLDSIKSYTEFNYPNNWGYVTYSRDTTHYFEYDYNSENPHSTPVTINITSVTSSTIQGTFNGDLFLDGNDDSAKATVTGRFNFNR
jgi:hypothetical protein